MKHEESNSIGLEEALVVDWVALSSLAEREAHWAVLAVGLGALITLWLVARRVKKLKVALREMVMERLIMEVRAKDLQAQVLKVQLEMASLRDAMQALERAQPAPRVRGPLRLVPPER
jgi:hypothetical protein